MRLLEKIRSEGLLAGVALVQCDRRAPNEPFRKGV
jgi:hypothetical protein